MDQRLLVTSCFDWKTRGTKILAEVTRFWAYRIRAIPDVESKPESVA